MFTFLGLTPPEDFRIDAYLAGNFRTIFLCLALSAEVYGLVDRIWGSNLYSLGDEEAISDLPGLGSIGIHRVF
jgi:hypothetical protein